MFLVRFNPVTNTLKVFCAYILHAGGSSITHSIDISRNIFETYTTRNNYNQSLSKNELPDNQHGGAKLAPPRAAPLSADTFGRLNGNLSRRQSAIDDHFFPAVAFHVDHSATENRADETKGRKKERLRRVEMTNHVSRDRVFCGVTLIKAARSAFPAIFRDNRTRQRRKTDRFRGVRRPCIRDRLNEGSMTHENAARPPSIYLHSLSTPPSTIFSPLHCAYLYLRFAIDLCEYAGGSN